MGTGDNGMSWVHTEIIRDLTLIFFFVSHRILSLTQNARIASLACGLPDEYFNLTQNSQKTQNLSQVTLAFNSQNARIASLACGLRDEYFNLTQKRSSLAEGKSNSQNLSQVTLAFNSQNTHTLRLCWTSGWVNKYLYNNG